MEHGNSQKTKIQFFSVISIFVFLVDIYLIVNMKENYPILGVAAVATLVSITLTISAWMKWKELDSQRAEEQYVDIMKAEKSTHLVSQKKFQDLDEKLNFIGQKIMPLEKSSSVNQKKIADMLETLMDGQKKVAKVTISRSKENANALMNSNDQLLKQMEEFQQTMLEIKTEVIDKQNEIYDKKLQKMGDNQKEIIEKIQESSSLIQNIIEVIPGKIQESTDLIQNIVEAIPEKVAQNPPSVIVKEVPVEREGYQEEPSEIMSETVSEPEWPSETASYVSEGMPEETAEFEREEMPIATKEPETEEILEPELAAEPEAMPESELAAEPEVMPEATEEPQVETAPEIEPEVIEEFFYFRFHPLCCFYLRFFSCFRFQLWCYFYLRLFSFSWFQL